MKTKTIIIILVILIFLAAGTWIYLGTKPASLPTNGTAPDPGNSGTGSGTNGTPAPAASPMPLQQGASGPLVKAIQEALNKKYKSGLVTDGSWGPKTQTALKANNLPVIIYWKQWAEITGLPLSSDGTFTIPSILPVWNNPLTWF